MEYSAILHDMDKRFCYAIDKDLFVIRVQVKKDDIKEIYVALFILVATNRLCRGFRFLHNCILDAWFWQ